MTHLEWAMLYSGMRACFIRLRSGWGSDGNVYNVLRGLRIFGNQEGHNAQPLDMDAAPVQILL